MTQPMDDLMLPPHEIVAYKGDEPVYFYTADQVRDYAKQAVAQLEQDNASLRQQNTMLDAKLAEMEKALAQALEAMEIAFDQTCSVGRPKDWSQIDSAINTAKQTLGAST